MQEVQKYEESYHLGGQETALTSASDTNSYWVGFDLTRANSAGEEGK